MLDILNNLLELIKDVIYGIISFDPAMFPKAYETISSLTHPENYNAFEIAKAMKNAWGYLISFLLLFRSLYVIVGFFTTRKFKPAKSNHKYAILVAARKR